MAELGTELHAAGVCSKFRPGRRAGAGPLGRGAVHHMLQNRLYRGKISHKGEVYPGQHEAIVDPALWDRVQAVLDENRVERDSGAGATEPSLLAGLVYDEDGGRLSPTHANKRGRRYRYYSSQSLIRPEHSEHCSEACRVPAADLEAAVEHAVVDLLQDQGAIDDVGRLVFVNVSQRQALIAAARDLASRLPAMARADE